MKRLKRLYVNTASSFCMIIGSLMDVLGVAYGKKSFEEILLKKWPMARNNNL